MYQRALYLTVMGLIATPLAAQHFQPLLGYNLSNRVYAEVDYLLWYAHEDGVVLASLFSGTVAPNGVDDHVQQDDIFFRNKWRSGVRATLGFRPALRSWDVKGLYTNFSTHLRRFDGPFSIDLGGNGGLIFANYIPLASAAFQDNLLVTSSASSTWSLDFNQFDIEFGKEFLFSEDVTFRPFFGLRGLWVTQLFGCNNTIETVAATSGIITSTSNTISIFAPHTRFDGGGARCGFDIFFNLFSSLDVYGNLAGGILWGRAKVKEPFSQMVTTTGSANVFNYDTLNHSHQASVLNFDFGLGVRWNQWLSANRYLLTLKFGWEQHVYSNMNQLQQLAAVFTYNNYTDTDFLLDHNVYRGDLSLSGFIFAVGLFY